MSTEINSNPASTPAAGNRNKAAFAMGAAAIATVASAAAYASNFFTPEKPCVPVTCSWYQWGCTPISCPAPETSLALESYAAIAALGAVSASAAWLRKRFLAKTPAKLAPPVNNLPPRLTETPTNSMMPAPIQSESEITQGGATMSSLLPATSSNTATPLPAPFHNPNELHLPGGGVVRIVTDERSPEEVARRLEKVLKNLTPWTLTDPIKLPRLTDDEQAAVQKAAAWPEITYPCCFEPTKVVAQDVWDSIGRLYPKRDEAYERLAKPVMRITGILKENNDNTTRMQQLTATILGIMGIIKNLTPPERPEPSQILTTLMTDDSLELITDTFLAAFPNDKMTEDTSAARMQQIKATFTMRALSVYLQNPTDATADHLMILRDRLVPICFGHPGINPNLIPRFQMAYTKSLSPEGFTLEESALLKADKPPYIFQTRSGLKLDQEWPEIPRLTISAPGSGQKLSQEEQIAARLGNIFPAITDPVATKNLSREIKNLFYIDDRKIIVARNVINHIIKLGDSSKSIEDQELAFEILRKEVVELGLPAESEEAACPPASTFLLKALYIYLENPNAGSMRHLKMVKELIQTCFYPAPEVLRAPRFEPVYREHLSKDQAPS